MIRFSLLSSGSSGNAILIRTDSAKILIDNGLSLKQLTLRSADIGESIDDLDAVFITHEHTDHVGGLGTLARRHGPTVYMTEGTRANLPRSVGDVPRCEVFEAGEAIPVDGVTVQSYSVTHDAADPVGYVLDYKGVKLGLAADLGYCCQMIKSRLEGAHGLILESNYCPDMLRTGRYPPMVQQRIRGRQGHLSNHDSSALLATLLHDRLQVVVLSHVSEENNTRHLAYETAAAVVGQHTAQLYVARQDRPTRMFEIHP